MPIYSYQRFVSSGETFYDISLDYLSTSHIEVHVDGTKQTSGFTVTSSPNRVTFDSATTSGSIILIKRVTPKTKTEFQSNVVDFTDGSVLTETDLDNAALGLLYISQEAEDSATSEALGLDQIDENWTAENKRIKNVSDPSAATDAVNKQYTDGLSLYNSPSVPELYGPFTATASQTEFTLSPAPASTNVNSFYVDIDGVVQKPTTDSTVSGSTLTLASGASAGEKVTVRNIGVMRDILGENPTVAGNLSVTGTTTTTGGIAGNLNILTGALQMAGTNTLTIRQVVVGTTSSTAQYTKTDAPGSFFTHGRSVTITPKSTDSVILLLAKVRMDFETVASYSSNKSLGANAYFYTGDSAAAGSAVNGAQIANSFSRIAATFSASGDFKNVFDTHNIMWYLVPAADHTTAQVKYSIGFENASTAGQTQISPDDANSSLIAIEIG